MTRGIRRLGVLLLLALAACGTRDRGGPQPCVLRIGTSGDYAPFSLAAGDDFDGLDADIARRLGADLGCRVELVRFAWPDLVAALGRGDFDLAVSGITMRAERALHGLYSRPYARTGVVVLTARDDEWQSLADLDRPSVRLAVNRGGHLERWARAHLARAALRTTADNRGLPELLRARAVDAIVTDSAEARAWAHAGRQIGPFSTDYKALLLAPGRTDLAPAVDRWLAARESDGWLASRRSLHLGDAQADDPRTAAVQAVTALVRLRLALMPMVAAAKRDAGAPLADTAQERRVVDRARSWSVAPGPHIDAAFAALIDLAKLVQRRATGSASAPPLAVLRDAIANVDRQLVRELDRLAAEPASPVDWAAALAPVAQDLPLRKSDLHPLAAALARL